MGEMVRGLCQIVVSALRSKRDLALENAALRHQLMVLSGSNGDVPRPLRFPRHVPRPASHPALQRHDLTFGPVDRPADA